MRGERFTRIMMSWSIDCGSNGDKKEDLQENSGEEESQRNHVEH